MAKDSVFSVMNNVTDYNFYDSPFASFYGFTKHEVDCFFKEYDISDVEKRKATDWYDGYRFIRDPDLKIYSPWSILKFLSHRNISNYWYDFGKIIFLNDLFKLDKIKKTVVSLLNEEDVELNLNDLKFTSDDCIVLRSLINGGKYKVDDTVIDLFLSWLFATGYLTIDVDKSSSLELLTCIKIPNQPEIKSEFESKLLSHYRQTLKIDSLLFDKVIIELENLFQNTLQISINEELGKSTNNLRNSLENLFAAFQPFIDTKEENLTEGLLENEDFIRSAINYTVLQIYCCNFETEVWMKKRARADIVIINLETNVAMIIELKYGELADSAQKALIRAESYLKVFEDYPNTNSILFLEITVSKEKKVSIAISKKDNFSRSTSV
jgi:hypothetical protein